MFSKKIVLVITLILGILLTFVAILNRLPRKNISIPTQTPSSTTASTPLPGVQKSNIVPISPQKNSAQIDMLPQNVISSLTTELPYETDSILIEYYPHDRVIMVTMKQPGEDTIAKAVRWLTEQGVTDPEHNARVIFSYWKNQ
ncbi:hypothetical protein COU88_01875 [Candidatus Roizmanbacteria bacterium CG10_big_fil_rev_8_21_14_0_10_39_6]|uniref:DUF3105 domain-containing protein n=1 Tax=Candidatus Roizmanbacteria bacterium CG10_big_fil_rev_8_21_14_0_10_39_6 TaxID=1974853 RepID=A0A2M8KSW6_9BACT|nr:MAG: hypothetical protein COU88_01875 [Candidatus Roizmanbacteria bacterium CG10_big_fil_rev_8_21_14_0_10_39_6]